MLTYTYISKGKFGLVEKPKPIIQHRRDAIVKVTLASICSSDLHIKHGSVPRAVEGITVGHEMVGVVEEVGSAVTHVKPGDRVTVNVETFCGECFFCKKGFVNNCTDMNGGWALGCRIDGGQAEYVRVPFADQGLNKIPDTVTDRQALLVGDVLATGYWAAKISEITEDDTVLIIGAGPTGICTLLCVMLKNPKRIIVCEKDENRIKFVNEHYPDVLTVTPEECLDFVRKNSDHGGADVVFDVAGAENTFELAWQCARPNAIVTVVALYNKAQTLPLPDMYGKNLTFKIGGVDGCDCEETLKLIAEGRLDTEPLITHTYPLSKIDEAYELFENKRDGVIKVAVECSNFLSYNMENYMGIEYCERLCGFYSKCMGNCETCVKETFKTALESLTPREERIIRLSFGIECKQHSLDEIAREVFSIVYDSELAYYKQRVRQLQSKALRKLRHPRCAQTLRKGSIGVVLFGSTEKTSYSELWLAIFGESNREALYEEFTALAANEKAREEAKKLLEKEKAEWQEKKKECQSGITKSTTVTNCYFGNKFEGGTFDSEITIEELIKLDGTSLFNECGYDKTIFEEIVVVLASHSFYFSDCTENYRVDLPSYIKQIFDKCANQISLKILHTNIERLDFSIRTYNVLKRAGIETIGDLLQHTEEDIVKIRNIGKSGFEEIVQKLETMGLSLAKSNDNIMRECDGERSLIEKVLALPVDELNLSTNCRASLKTVGISTVEDLIEKTYDDLVQKENIDSKYIAEVIGELATLGLFLKTE